MLFLHDFREQNRTFWHRWWSYAQILIIIDLLINLAFIPLLSLLANGILSLNRIRYVSYTNIVNLLTKKPWAMLELLILLLIVLMIVFLQFAIVFISFRDIKSELNLGWRNYLVELRRQILPIPFKTFGFFLLYFLLILPFGGIGLYTPLLNKVQIPQFISDWLFQEHLAWGICLIVVYVVILYIGVRWMFVLPEMIFDREGARQAISHSWEKTRHHLWHYALYIVLLSLVVTIFTTVLFLILIGIQWLFDFLPLIAKSSAIVILTLIQLINAAAGYYFTSMIALLMISEVPTPQKNELIDHGRSRRWPWFIVIGIATVGFATYGGLYFNNLLLERPVTISHRGVDNGNGVQNTISALKKTSKEKPDYVEMDVQETKDHKFIVLHDESLNNLAGINRGPEDLTLNELKKVRVYENNQSDTLASFDDYLNEANRLHQKLLVELKDTSSTQPDFVKNFSNRYQTKLRENHAMIHSLDYDFVEQSRTDMPNIPANYILSFNLSGVPVSKATGFTMEATTLNDTFIDDAHFQNKKVYAWTVNDTDTMDKMIFLNVDGIVTDNLSDLKSEINQTFNTKSYAGQIWNYIRVLNDPTR